MIQTAFIFSILITGFAHSALAQTEGRNKACRDRLTALQGERAGVQQVTQPVLNAAAPSLAHFLKVTKTEGAIRQYTAYFSLQFGTITGYRYTIAAKDRSSPTKYFYFQDVRKKLVYAQTDNEKPKTYWVCE